MRMFLRPRWLFTHVLVATLAITFISLGFWQLQRLDERRADNARIAENMAAPQQPLDQTLAQYGNDPDALKYRRVQVTGRYRPADEVLLTPRASNRQAGHHVVTPLELDGGRSAVLVERGWVPFAMDTPPISEAAPPTGEVTVSGNQYPTQGATRYGSSGSTATGDNTGDAGRLTFLSVTDVDRIQPQVDIPLLPVSILLQQQTPPADGLPIPGSAPVQSEGNHESYALQWFFFATITLGGYPLLLRRSWRGRQEQQHQPGTDQATSEDLLLRG